MVEIYDHDDEPIEHGRAGMYDDIRLHSATAGSSESLPFVHGTLRVCYWYKLSGRFSENFIIIVPGPCGFGDSNKPVAKEG